MERYALLLREYCRVAEVSLPIELVFLGDTGQGDLSAATQALRAGTVSVAFLNHVGHLQGETRSFLEQYMFKAPGAPCVVRSYAPVLHYLRHATI